MMHESQAFADLHADVYVSLAFEGRVGRLSVMIDVKPLEPGAPWWFRDPDIAIDFMALPVVEEVRVRADNGEAEGMREVHVPETLTEFMPNQTHSRVAFGPLSNGTRAFGEFEFTVGVPDERTQVVAGLQIEQSYGLRRFRGADSIRAEFGLVASLRDAHPVIEVQGPVYRVMWDGAEDGDPANLEPADMMETFDVELVPGSAGPCSHAWCLATEDV